MYGVRQKSREIKLHFYLKKYFQGQSKFIHYYQDPNLSNLIINQLNGHEK